MDYASNVSIGEYISLKIYVTAKQISNGHPIYFLGRIYEYHYVWLWQLRYARLTTGETHFIFNALSVLPNALY